MTEEEKNKKTERDWELEEELRTSPFTPLEIILWGT